MSTTRNTPQIDDLNNDLQQAMAGSRSVERAQRIYHGLTRGWGLPETVISEDGGKGIPVSDIKQRAADDPDFVAEKYGDTNFFIRAMCVGPDYVDSGQEVEAVDKAIGRATDPDAQKDDTTGIIDQALVGSATPVEFDPMIVDVQRSTAPIVTDYIMSRAQAGFTASYNIIDEREFGGFLSEAEAADLSGNLSNQNPTWTNRQKDMKLQVGLVEISDFSSMAEDSLNYIDLRETTIGQAVVAHTLQKARGMLYGDTAGTDNQDIGDADAFDGLATIFDDAGNSTSKTTVASGFLDDMLDELITKVTNTGLTWDRARFIVSPQMYKAIYSEATPVVRLDGYEADVDYGPRGISLGFENGTTQISPEPNIRSYGTSYGGNADSADPGDVFLIDEVAVQVRQLMPMTTVPLAKTDLTEKAALAEFYTLIDKSQGEHGEWLQAYDI